MSTLKFAINPKPRKFKWTFGAGSGPGERIKRLQMLVTGLVRHERIESTYSKCDETRGYAERLIQIAAKHGDKDKYAMEMADYWLLEKDLIHKLFKVLVPRYKNTTSAFTQLHRLPAQVPGGGIDMAVLELKGNPWPPVVPHKKDTKFLLTNILVNELRKDHEMATSSSLKDVGEGSVNEILEESRMFKDNLDMGLVNKLNNTVTESEKDTTKTVTVELV